MSGGLGGVFKQLFSRYGLLNFVEGFLLSFWCVLVLYVLAVTSLGFRVVGTTSLPTALIGIYAMLFFVWLALGGVLWFAGVDRYVVRLFRWLGRLGREHLKIYTALIVVLSVFWLPILMLVSLYIVRYLLVRLVGLR